MSLDGNKLNVVIHPDTKMNCYDLYQLSTLLGYSNKSYIKSNYTKPTNGKEHIKTVINESFAPYDEIIETFTSRRMRKPLVSQLLAILVQENQPQTDDEEKDDEKAEEEVKPVAEKVKRSTVKYKVNIIKEVNRHEPVEATCKRDLMDALDADNIDYKDEYVIGQYRIDLYIPKYKIAIEIDEHGHAAYGKEDEKNREDYIKEHLTKNIYRINPHNGLYRPAKIYGEIKRMFFRQLTA